MIREQTLEPHEYDYKQNHKTQCHKINIGIHSIKIMFRISILIKTAFLSLLAVYMAIL